MKPRFSNRLVIFATAFAVALLLTSYASGKKRSVVPEEFGTAKTVFVETEGGDITNLRLASEDRQAILDTQDAIEAWGRYSLSRSRLDADLIVVIRKGREWPDTANPNSPIGSGSTTARLPGQRTPLQGAGSQGPIAQGHGAQNPADASNSDGTTTEAGRRREKDQLRIYTRDPSNKLRGPLWRDEQDRGLDPARPILLDRLRLEIDKAFPANKSAP